MNSTGRKFGATSRTDLIGRLARSRKEQQTFQSHRLRSKLSENSGQFIRAILGVMNNPKLSKRCNGCRKVLPIDRFRKMRNGYRRGRCGLCEGLRIKKRSDERRRTRVCSDCEQKFVGYNRRCNQCHQINRITKRYNITRQQLDQMYRDQNNRCRICNRKRKLVVDHDHRCCGRGRSCGKCVRGLLCSRCNLRLGWFESHHQSIIKYLRETRSTIARN